MSDTQGDAMHPAYGANDDEGTARVAVLMGIPSVLRQLGVDPALPLGRLGFTEALFSGADNTIPYRAAGSLLQVCAEMACCPHFGLLVGQLANAASLGRVGHLVQTSSTVQLALQELVAHMHAQTRGGVPTHTIEGELATLGYAMYLRDMPGTPEGYDLVAALECNILLLICGPLWRPQAVLLAHAKPVDPAPYEAFFACPVTFDADRTAICFRKSWLLQPPLAADARTHQRLQREILDEELDVPEALLHHVRRALRAMIWEGQTSELLLSQLLMISPRTLHRKLAKVGLTFRAVLDEVHFEVARQLLTDTEMTTTQLADALEYSDASAFNRAFRRWTSTSPAAWRASLRSR